MTDNMMPELTLDAAAEPAVPELTLDGAAAPAQSETEKKAAEPVKIDESMLTDAEKKAPDSQVICAWRRDWWRFAKCGESVERWGVAARLMAVCEMRGMRRAMGRGGAIGGGLPLG